jgi:prolyl oligopeptidase
MTTGPSDPRVAPWQSRKFTAALQDATLSTQQTMLLTRMSAGRASARRSVSALAIRRSG